MLKRHGVSRERRTERPQTTGRYEWTEAGALLHVERLRAAQVPPPRPLGPQRARERHGAGIAGKAEVIGVIDDHTRLAYCELHSPENADTVSATPRRAAAGMREKGSRSARPSRPTTRSATRAARRPR